MRTLVRMAERAPVDPPLRTFEGAQDKIGRVVASRRARAVTVAGLFAMAAFASVASASPGLGDAPESVMGIRDWRVVHAPGYAWYTTLGHGFGSIFAVGAWGLRANLFSAVVSVVAAVGVADIALRLGVRATAAVLASAAWVTTTSVWFYAGYAKHDALSTAWLVLILWVVAGDWRAPSARRVGLVGLLGGLALGLGWPPIASAGAGLVMWAVWDPGRCRRAIAGAVGVVGGAAVVAGLVLWRSAVVPGSFGSVDSGASLLRLWSMADFGTGADPGRAAAGSWGPLRELARYSAVIGRDIGPLLVLVALGGLCLAWSRTDRAGRVLVAMAVGNLAAVLTVLDARVWGFRSGIVQGGFLAPTTLVLACGAGLGTDRLGTVLADRMDRRIGWALIAGVLVLPGALIHHGPARQLQAPVAETYGRQVLESLPRDAVLLTGSLSTSFPVELVRSAGTRHGVTIVTVDGLATDWYGRQVEANLGRPLAALTRSRGIGVAVALIRSEKRPVYLDAEAQALLAGRVAYRPIGLVAEALPGTVGYRRPAAPAALVALINDQSQASGIATDPARGRWPNDEVARAYARPLLLIAQDSINSGDQAVAIRALEVATGIEPANHAAARTLADLRAGP